MLFICVRTQGVHKKADGEDPKDWCSKAGRASLCTKGRLAKEKQTSQSTSYTLTPAVDPPQKILKCTK
eukprot:1117297-Amphidinium_carterae.1